jgi:hypothetical protein
MYGLVVEGDVSSAGALSVAAGASKSANGSSESASKGPRANAKLGRIS